MAALQLVTLRCNDGCVAALLRWQCYRVQRYNVITMVVLQGTMLRHYNNGIAVRRDATLQWWRCYRAQRCDVTMMAMMWHYSDGGDVALQWWRCSNARCYNATAMAVLQRTMMWCFNDRGVVTHNTAMLQRWRCDAAMLQQWRCDATVLRQWRCNTTVLQQWRCDAVVQHCSVAAIAVL